ncbi:MAG TPA: M48 family metalloprotease [Candidatus Obscuribacter sp.]|nr:M48 family metalloprotease [Candidatus Obscuribacter sp.]HMW91124.1 M48 family metalloprotease [Candidatus Obscuribacter sp.]HMY02119.1 M48 family metalloprotease [Candidatus Obscuribacter sp.]HNA74091.1 M48 family metalloprotease [Candidatus Obscuribacter sp.]HNB14275.1 M48 family metalloprotease [Candidatus Obscuribacter sp.]
MKNHKHSNKYSGPDPSVDQASIDRQLRINWIRTIFGIALMGGLSFAGLVFLGVNFTVATVILFFFSVLMPLFGWWNSANLVLKMMRCRPPNMNDRDHARLVRLVDEIYPLTGLKKKPEVFISPLPIPNAFATGRSPSTAFIAATEGLFAVGLEDREIKAILAHELAHVKSRDVAITSLVAVLGSLFSILLAGFAPGMFNACFSERNNREDLVGKLSNKVKRDKKRFADPASAVTGFFITLVVFYIASIFAKLITLFVSRSRESAADVLAANWTRDPCALATALQKIVDWMNRNKAALQLKILLGGMEPLLFVSLHEGEEGLNPPPPKGWLARLRKWVGHLGDNHPPVEDRVTLLDGLAGSVCPRMHDIRADEAKRRRERIREERQRLNSKSAPPAVPPAVPPTASEEGQEGTADEGSETKPGQDPK